MKKLITLIFVYCFCASIACAFPELEGEIVFDSNRAGNFGIYAIKANGKGLRTIIDGPAHEIFPKASSDGKWVVYAEKTSLERYAPAKVYLVDRYGNNKRLISESGTFPSFSKDGKVIYFERSAKKVLAVDFDGKNEREIFPKSTIDFPKYKVIKPLVSPDGKYVAFASDKKGRWNAWIAEIETGKGTHIHRGCEPTWFEDSKRLLWMRKKAKNPAVWMFDRVSREKLKIQDAPPPRSHEYFPRLALNDKYLLFAAAPDNQHDHGTSNYQIFVKNLKNEKVLRVNNDAYTNRWPDYLPPVRN